jgi:HJR/Mrr/RecB family endonuclease
MAITNNHFTREAIKLAHANNVILWDRERLSAEILATQKRQGIF